MEYDFDAIVCGGGIAGILTATSILTYNPSARVLVVDRNHASEIGKKTYSGWVCGDAATESCFDYIKSHLGIQYDSSVLGHEVHGAIIYSPDHKKGIGLDEGGHIINRRLFSHEQMMYAQKLGVEFAFGIEAESLTNHDGYINGIRGRDRSDNSVFKKTASITIDATGVGSVLRRNFPLPTLIQKHIDPDDLSLAGRDIIEFDVGTEDERWFDANYCLIHLNQEYAPGGYCWAFPKGERKANMGVGVQVSALIKRNKRLGRHDNLSNLIDQYIRKNPVIKNPRLSEADIGNQRGYSVVSRRRHNDCLVHNGCAIIGDSAWMARPLDAGGIGPIMRAGVILGEVVAEAIETKDFSQKSLWTYNVRYMREYGGNMASFEVLSKLLQSLTNEDLNYAMSHLISQKDIDKIGKKETPDSGTWDKIKKVPWAFPKPGLAKKLIHFYNASKVINKINKQYPTDPDDFKRWQSGLLLQLHEAERGL
jgi:flavin-dependent dehydrogenase